MGKVTLKFYTVGEPRMESAVSCRCRPPVQLTATGSGAVQKYAVQM